MTCRKSSHPSISSRARPRKNCSRESIAFPIFLAVSIGMFNQLSGINAILYYLNDIFDHAGFSKVSGNLQAVAIGATNLLFTMIAMSVIDRLGRKTLLLVGSVGTALCLAGVSIIFFTGQHQNLLVWLLVGYIAFFAFSQGAVIWVYLSEVFPNSVRAKGQSLGSFSHWFMNAGISLIFPLMAATSGAYPFVFFSVMMVVQFFVVSVLLSGDQRLVVGRNAEKAGRSVKQYWRVSLHVDAVSFPVARFWLCPPCFPFPCAHSPQHRFRSASSFIPSATH